MSAATFQLQNVINCKAKMRLRHTNSCLHKCLDVVHCQRKPMHTIFSLLVLYLSFSASCQSLESQLQKIVHDSSFITKIKLDLAKRTTISGSGEALLPVSFANKRTGTKDSYRGEISNGLFTIYYDIGFLAGIHMHEELKDSVSIYIDTFFDGHRISIGLRRNGKSKEMIITILGTDKNDPLTFPANFWASVKNEEEMKQTLRTALSYRKKR